MTIRNGGGKIRVLIVAASAARRAELERIVGENPSFNPAGTLAGLSGLGARVSSLHSDVVLVDLPEPDPQFASISLAVQRAGGAVVALVDDPDPTWTARVVRAGVLGVLTRNSDPFEIHAAIQAANRGLLLLEPDIARELVGQDAARSSESALEGAEQLTAREVEVLRMMAE